MTKKEQAALHSDKCQMAAVDFKSGRGPEMRVIVSFSLSVGELAALRHQLRESPGPVGEDVLAFFANAAERANITFHE